MKIGLDKRVFEGTPAQIVKAMRDIAFTPRQFSLSEYIDWVVQNTIQFHEVVLTVSGKTDDERAASLINEMLENGLATRL